jgi:hypothetical protein
MWLMGESLEGLPEQTAVGNGTNEKKTTNSVALLRERTIPSDRRLSAKLVPNLEDKGCRVITATDRHGRIL